MDLARRNRAYTLIEMLLALVIFTIISVAVSVAYGSVVRAQNNINTADATNREASEVFSEICRDLQFAYASANDPNTMFIANMGTGLGQPVLLFSTWSRRLYLSQSDITTPDQSQTQYVIPRSDHEIVAYFWDPQSSDLYRCTTTIPNTSLLPQPGDPGSTRFQNIQALDIECYDGSSWQSSWDFQGGSSNHSQMSQSSTQPPTNTQLPEAVQITLRIGVPGGQSRDYSTSVMIYTPQPLAAGQTPPTTSSSGSNHSGANNSSSGHPNQSPGTTPTPTGSPAGGIPASGTMP